MPEIKFTKGPIVIGKPAESSMRATPHGLLYCFEADGMRCELLLSPDEATGMGVATIVGAHASRQLADEAKRAPVKAELAILRKRFASDPVLLAALEDPTPAADKESGQR